MKQDLKQMTLASRMIARAVFAAALTTSVGPGLSAGFADPSGIWRTDDGSVRVRIEHCGARLEQICGYEVWMKMPVDANGQPFRDRENPDPGKRSRPVLGHQLIMGLTQSADGHFDGRIYNAGNGKYYEVSMLREAPDRLEIKGCMLSILCGTRTWTETRDVLPGQLTGGTGDANGPKADPEWARAIQARPSAQAKAAR
jgi:uncharacterized protein (DUF2147 family)